MGIGARAFCMVCFHHNGPMKARLLAFVIWAAVAASAVFWLLRLWTSSPTAPANTVTVAAATPPRGDLNRVFGAPPTASPTAAPAEPALASRFKLLGVAAPREGGDSAGLALIAVDGKPARGFKVGAAIDGDLVLQSVHPRGAALGTKGAAPAVSLELPPVTGAQSTPRAAPPPTTLPGLSVPGTGPVVSVPTSIVPPPPTGARAPLPGMRPPEAGESAEPQPVAPPGGGANTR
jgi:general secretion pathway protein C